MVLPFLLYGSLIKLKKKKKNYHSLQKSCISLQKLDFSKIYDEWWLDDDPYEQLKRKRIKCAEILVPNVIAYEYINGAVVVDERAQYELESRGFQKKIVVQPKIFFRKED